MRVSDFDYELPQELIAQTPVPDRAAARMLVMARDSGQCDLRTFRDLPLLLRPGDCLVLNDTRVIPARLEGRRVPTGGRVEALVLEALGEQRWLCLLRPAARLRVGARVALLRAPEHGFTVAARRADGLCEIEFDTTAVLELLDRAGQVPLPPYIRRPASAGDRERYQTVYAARPGAVAAPTAGLHFTPEALANVAKLGVALARVTLHVGPGTFRPVKAERVEDHRMHDEAYELSGDAADLINGARAAGGRIIAVGTTAVRVLETCADSEDGTVRPGRGRTRLFLHPPMVPRAVDGLLTNFHLPRSTLLMLVCTFSSVANVLTAYRLAIASRFRFYSYGDCMLLLPKAQPAS
jgi:S-adenosylmethionine:tRNA ribosyltransferase-isomerase